MNIVLINPYAGSPQHGMQHRPFYLAREWVRQGHQVTVVASSYSHLRSQGQPSCPGAFAEEKIDGVRYLWLKTPTYHGNGAKRVLHMLAFAWQLRRQSKRIAALARQGIVIASSPHPFIIYGARRIAEQATGKLVFEVRDLWPLTMIEIGHHSPRHPFIRLMQHAEDYAYRHADRVVSLLPQAHLYMQEHGMTPEKFYYLPNGMDVAEWQSEQTDLPHEHRDMLGLLRQMGHFVVGYAGQHGLANALDTLLEAADFLRTEPISFVLVGQGPEKEALQKKARELGLTNVLFLPPIPKTSIPPLLAEMDALFIGWKRTPLYRFGVSPNKLMDYMMAAKPVIHSIEAGNDLVAESGCGLSVPPECAQAVADAILHLRARSPAERENLGRRGRDYVLAHHDYSVLARHFIEAMSGTTPLRQEDRDLAGSPR